MKQLCTDLKKMIAGTAVIVLFAFAGPSLSSAQETTEETTTETEVTSQTTAEKICEAQQRTEARYQKWINEGIPEEFGSEEPFTFDPSLC